MTTINATGTAELKFAPERATVYLHIAAGSLTKDEARENASYTLKFLSGGIAALGDQVKIETGCVSEWKYSKKDEAVERWGYRQQVVIRIEDLSKIPEIRDIIAESGELLSFQNIIYGLKDVKNRESLARVEAIANARKIAEDYATAIETKILRIDTISDIGADGYESASLGATRGAAKASGATNELPEFQAPETISIFGAVNMSFTSG